MIKEGIFLSLCSWSFLGCMIHQPSLVKEKSAQEMVDKGVVFLRGGMLEEAEAAFRVAVETEQIATAYDGMACVRILEGRLPEAEKILRQIIDWFPEYYNARANLALIFEMTGRKNGAEHLYEGVMSAQPLNARVRNNLGALLVESKKYGDLFRGRTYLTDAAVIMPHPLIGKNMKLSSELIKEKRDE